MNYMMEIKVEENGKWILENPEEFILSEIENKKVYRKQIAMTYALILRDHYNKNINWKKINQAIIDRWSIPGLIFIKNLAWNPNKLFGDKQR